MKTAGIIAEYNPFHYGHQYHIEQTRKKTGADYVIAIISGNFVQRGAPSVIDKYQRTKAALSSGCDLVLELPVVYSSASAEFFASGAVCLLDSLGICDFLSFGSEAGKLDQLSVLSDILREEPSDFKNILKFYLREGMSFPLAREKALHTYCDSILHCQFSNDFWSSLKQSNNILALEYLKSLKKIRSGIFPVTITRKNAPYHDKKLYEDFSSATAIRHTLFTSKDCSQIKHSV
ncbi:MAG: nucleotidyltransferase family protein, partial [Lachnospiraceae bacterium]|nr:nucleotidyltransferase family protein [Lachnospiraceae bacterium]